MLSKGLLLSRLVLGCAASFITEQQLGCRYLSGFRRVPGDASHRKSLAYPCVQDNARHNAKAQLSLMLATLLEERKLRVR